MRLVLSYTMGMAVGIIPIVASSLLVDFLLETIHSQLSTNLIYNSKPASILPLARTRNDKTWPWDNEYSLSLDLACLIWLSVNLVTNLGISTSFLVHAF